MVSKVEEVHHHHHPQAWKGVNLGQEEKQQQQQQVVAVVWVVLQAQAVWD